MKWKRPKNSETEVTKIFAFVPHFCLDSEEVHWLEYIYRKSVYSTACDYYNFSYYKDYSKKRLNNETFI